MEGIQLFLGVFLAFSEGPDLFFLLFIISFWNNRQVEVLSLNALYNVTVTHFSTLLWEDQLKKKIIKDYKTEGIYFLFVMVLSGLGQKKGAFPLQQRWICEGNQRMGHWEVSWTWPWNVGHEPEPLNKPTVGGVWLNPLSFKTLPWKRGIFRSFHRGVWCSVTFKGTCGALSLSFACLQLVGTRLGSSGWAGA